MTKAAESEWMGKVAALGCYLCRYLGYGPTPAQVHHLREGQGMSERASNWLTVPLCERHHSNHSPDGIHGGRKAWHEVFKQMFIGVEELPNGKVIGKSSAALNTAEFCDKVEAYAATELGVRFYDLGEH